MDKINENVNWKSITPGGDIYEGGSSRHFLTGDWRNKKPVYIQSKCKQCLLCYPVCPDSSIPLEGGKRFEFDFDHCKGCGICAKVCPFGAIQMIKEGEENE